MSLRSPGPACDLFGPCPPRWYDVRFSLQQTALPGGPSHGSTMYEKPQVRDYGDLTALTAVQIGQVSGEDVAVKSNGVKVI